MTTTHDRNSFVLYTDYAKHLELLDMSQRGALITAIFAHESGTEMPTMDAVTTMAFSFICSQLDRDREKYESVIAKRSEAGKRSAEARQNKTEQDATKATSVEFVETKRTKGNKREQTPTNPTDNDTDTDNDNDTDTDIKGGVGGKRKRFTPPSLEEVSAYCAERKNNVDPAGFIDFYVSKNWMVGKSKMTDWKASVRTWERREREAPKQTAKPNRFNNFEQRDYDYDSIEAQLMFGGTA